MRSSSNDNNLSGEVLHNLLSSDGHPAKVLQRAIAVAESTTSDDAITIAQNRFEQLEHVPDWTLHADLVEVERNDKELEGSAATAPQNDDS